MNEPLDIRCRCGAEHRCAQGPVFTFGAVAGLTEELWEAAAAYAEKFGDLELAPESQRVVSLVRRKRAAERRPRFTYKPSGTGRGFCIRDGARHIFCDGRAGDDDLRRIVEALSEKEGRWL